MSLSGDWFNELGSKMTLVVDGQSVTGKYYTAVGNAQGIYEIFGRSTEDNTVLGFAVAWQNAYGDSDSATAWSGQYHVAEDVIVTTWLLTDQTDDAQDWKSTIVGKDAFQRQAPAVQTARQPSQFRAPSHPARLTRQ